MGEQPLISVIIPVYKVEAWLDNCVQSVVNQTWQALEILLVDDGSPDRCGELCDLWAQKDSRIHVLHKKNSGLSGARNAGLDIATGDYILFLDSDDMLHPQICEQLYSCLTQHNAQIAVCDAAHIFPGQTPAYELTEQCQVMTAREAIAQMWYQLSFLPSAWAKLYKREIFRDSRFTEGLLYEDIDLMHTLFWQAQQVVYNPSRMYGYNHREDSITTKPFSVRDLDILKVSQKLLDFASDTAPELLSAAKCYACVASLRVALNAPKTPDLAQGHAQAQSYLKAYSKEVLKDTRIRKKTRYGLMLYTYCRPLISIIYKRINRWK